METKMLGGLCPDDSENSGLERNAIYIRAAGNCNMVADRSAGLEGGDNMMSGVNEWVQQHEDESEVNAYWLGCTVNIHEKFKCA